MSRCLLSLTTRVATQAVRTTRLPSSIAASASAASSSSASSSSSSLLSFASHRTFAVAATGTTVTPQEAATVIEKPDPASSPLGLTGGAPEEFVRRTCRIYKPSRSATQQGAEYRWKIEFDTPNKWVNPLMGWTSARDTAQQLREMLYFQTQEQAIAFAEREGFHWTILPHHSKKLKAKSFAENFKWKGPPKDESK